MKRTTSEALIVGGAHMAALSILVIEHIVRNDEPWWPYGGIIASIIIASGIYLVGGILKLGKKYEK